VITVPDVSGDRDIWLKVMFPVDLRECRLLCAMEERGDTAESAIIAATVLSVAGWRNMESGFLQPGASGDGGCGCSGSGGWLWTRTLSWNSAVAAPGMAALALVYYYSIIS